MTLLEESSHLGEFQLVSVLGKGGFMTVYKARDPVSNNYCALKVLSADATDREVKHFMNDITILQKLSHPFIPAILRTTTIDQQRVAAQEYVSGGNLLQRLRESKRMDEPDARRLFTQILSVVTYLHEEKRIIHRDLKLENVLLDSDDNVKLIDFGFAEEFTNDNDEFTLPIGSPAYIAPEIAQGLPYNAKAEIWSLGVILYCLVCGQYPFEGPTVQVQLQKIVLSEPTFPSFLSEDLVDLLMKMLTKEAGKRATLTEIREHPWMTTVCDQKLDSLGEIVDLFDRIPQKIESSVKVPVLPRKMKPRPRFMPIQARRNAENSQRIGNEGSVADFRKKTSIVAAKQYRRSFQAIIQNIL